MTQKDEIQELFRKLRIAQKNNDKEKITELFNQIYTKHSWIISVIKSSFIRRGYYWDEEIEDTVTYCLKEKILRSDGYNPDHVSGSSFATYAIKSIEGILLNEIKKIIKRKELFDSLYEIVFENVERIDTLPAPPSDDAVTIEKKLLLEDGERIIKILINNLLPYTISDMERETINLAFGGGDIQVILQKMPKVDEFRLKILRKILNRYQAKKIDNIVFSKKILNILKKAQFDKRYYETEFTDILLQRKLWFLIKSCLK